MVRSVGESANSKSGNAEDPSASHSCVCRRLAAAATTAAAAELIAVVGTSGSMYTASAWFSNSYCKQ